MAIRCLMMRCLSCNEQDHPTGAKYCHACGAELHDESVQGVELMLHGVMWVPVKDFDERFYKRINTDRFDLSQMLNEFVDYLNTRQELFDVEELSLYIEEMDFKTFIIHLYDTINNKVMQIQDGFNYYISTKSLYNAKNIKGIFKYEKHSAITCRFDRIAKLQERILDDTLTF